MLLFIAWLIYAFLYEDVSFKYDLLKLESLQKDTIIMQQEANARAVRDSLVTKDVVRRSVKAARRKFELENED